MAWNIPEIIAIVTVGVVLAGLAIRGQHRLEDRLLGVEKEQARTSGLLEGLGLTRRAAPTSNHGVD